MGPLIWYVNAQVRMWIILDINYKHYYHLGKSKICAGLGDYFRTSKPHSEKLWLVSGCTHHEDALHAEGVGDVRSRAGALCPPTGNMGMEAAFYGECRVVLHTTCFRLQLHQIGAVSCYDRCWVHHRCRNLTVAPNRSRHPNAIMRLEPKVILTVVLRHYPTWNLPFNNSFILFSVATIEKPA